MRGGRIPSQQMRWLRAAWTNTAATAALSQRDRLTGTHAHARDVF